ncbi:uncharacterized protein CIMG_11013 [Coccidioides immitis RS]|uniref:Uncharacterized protein n=2 Tax=Coccidioides immitis TaxID=5501 RepID=A0A0D8JSJ6_COCIM|nr:uncharacterized protein CIMG_11013 [Coccidioides immitis RS]KJF59956.1 hypothetical protein CIMG_11013 [Coccidioides immitis RS]KMU77093.1 hypothetical protein CISG_06131 [Coccidioides immitis RMSCC 3703]
MSQSSDPITYLPLPKSLHAAIKAAISATSDMVISDSNPIISNFDLPDNESLKLVVEEAKKAYQKEKFPSEVSEEAEKAHQKEKFSSEVSVLSSHGAVFRGSWRSGRQNDTVIVPLIDYHTEVTAWNQGGEITRLDWHWTNAIFVRRLTFFNIEEGREIGAVIIQFKR